MAAHVDVVEGKEAFAPMLDEFQRGAGE